MGDLGRETEENTLERLRRDCWLCSVLIQESSSPQLPSMLSEERIHQSRGAQWLLGPWHTVTVGSILAAENRR